MGTICAFAYANIFMASFESKYIFPHKKEKDEKRFYGSLMTFHLRAIEIHKRTKPKIQSGRI